MKKLMLIVPVALLLISAACGAKLEESRHSTEDPLAGITMTVKEQVVDAKAENATVIARNMTDKEVMYGAPFELEIECDGAWYTCQTIGDIAWIDIAYIIEPNGTSESAVSLYNMYGALKPGSYRVVKTFYIDGESGVAFAGFEVK